LANLLKWRISTTIAAFFGLAIFFLALIALLSYVLTDQTSDEISRIEDTDLPLQQAALQMKATNDQTAKAVSDYVENQEAQYLEQANDAEADFEASAQQFQSIAQTAWQHSSAQQIAGMYESFKRSRFTIIILAEHQAADLDQFQEDASDLSNLINQNLIQPLDRVEPGAMDKLEAGFEMQFSVDQVSEVIKAYAAASETVPAGTLQDIEAQFNQSATDFKSAGLSPSEETWLNKITQDFSAITSDADQIVQNTDELQAMMAQFEQAHAEISAYLDDQIIAPIKQSLAEAVESAGDSANTANSTLLILGIIGLVISAPLAWIAARRILKPLGEMVEGARIIRAGKLEHRFYTDSRDEFGKLAFAMNQMLDHIRRSREALGESEETAWALLDATTDSVILTDIRGIILASNEVAAQRFDKSLEQMIDHSLYDLLPADLMASRKAQIAEVIRSRKPLHLEDERDGMILDTRIFPVFNDKGNVIRIAIFSRDITTRKWVEEVTEQLAHRNELILESAGEGIYGLDTEGRTTFVNPIAARMLGYKPEDLIGQKHHELVHHSRPNGMPYPHEMCPIYAAFKDGAVHRNVGDEVFWRKDGTSFPVNYTSTPIFENGKIAGAVVTFQDITDRVRVETALRQSEEKYRLLFDKAASLIVTSDRNGVIIDANHQAKSLLGYPPEALVGHNLIEYIHPEDIPQARTCLGEVLTEGFKYDNRYKLVRKDGTVINANLNAATITDTDGEYLRTICMIDRITDPREEPEADDALEQ